MPDDPTDTNTTDLGETWIPGKTTLTVASVVLALVALVAVALVAAGVFGKQTSDSDVKIAIGMLTLLGGMVASALTFVGVLLKHSIDRHAARIADEAERSRQREAADTEARLRLETSIKAVELLTLPSGEPAPSARQSGALFVLGSTPLQQLDLALALLREHWGTGNISTSAAVWVIDQALCKTDDVDLQTEAARTLERGASRLVSGDGNIVEWPDSLNVAWPAESMPELARNELLSAAATVLGTRKPQDWKPGLCDWFILQFAEIRTHDASASIRAGATLVLHAMLDQQRRAVSSRTLLGPDGPVHLDELRSEVAAGLEEASKEASVRMLEHVANLRSEWVGGALPPQSQPGAT